MEVDNHNFESFSFGSRSGLTTGTGTIVPARFGVWFVDAVVLDGF